LQPRVVGTKVTLREIVEIEYVNLMKVHYNDEKKVGPNFFLYKYYIFYFKFYDKILFDKYYNFIIKNFRIHLGTYLFMKKESKGNKPREKAEEIISDKSEMPSFDRYSELVYELQTHQIELELQNKELENSQEELEEAKLKYFNLYEFAPVGYFSLNKNEIVKDVNLAGAALLGAEKLEIINGAFIRYIDFESRRTFYKHLKKIKNTGKKQTCQLKLIKKDGNKIYAHLETIHLQNDDKNEFRITVTDITELINAEDALKVSDERYNLMVEAVNEGVWDWNVRTGEAYFSSIYYKMLGYDVGEFPANYESFRSLIHPDDIESFEKKLQYHIVNAEGFSHEIRLKTKDGKWRWILTKGKVVEIDEDGKPLRMVGSHTDITKRKRAEEAVLKAKNEWVNTFDAVPDLTP